MTNHKKITQIMLIMLGIFLILATYVYGPLSQKRKLSEANLKMQEQQKQMKIQMLYYM